MHYSLSVSILLIFLQCSSFAVEYEANTGCNAIGYDCVVWPDDSSGVIDLSDEVFLKYAGKVEQVNVSVKVVKTKLSALPHLPLLKQISGFLNISDNPELTYSHELEGLERVDGPVVIRNNPKFQIPLSLYSVLCKESNCEADVICYGNAFAVKGNVFNLDRRCTILHGDLFVTGQTEESSSKSGLEKLFKIHTVFGAVHLSHNELNSFGILRSLRRIEYRGVEGCALSVLANQGLTRLGLDSLKEITVTPQNSSAQAYCVKKNRMAEGNKYYRLDSDVNDKKVFTALVTSAKAELDSGVGEFEWAAVKSLKKPTLSKLNIASCVLVALLAVSYIIWLIDYTYGILFYEKPTTEISCTDRKEEDVRREMGQPGESAKVNETRHKALKEVYISAGEG